VLFIQLAEHCKQATTETTICNCSPNHPNINRGRYVHASVCRGKAAALRATRRSRGLASPRWRARRSRVMSRQSGAQRSRVSRGATRGGFVAAKPRAAGALRARGEGRGEAASSCRGKAARGKAACRGEAARGKAAACRGEAAAFGRAQLVIN